MSTELMTYLNYMSTWETESDGNIDKIIAEQTLFVALKDFAYEPAIDSEFSTLNSLAITVRDETIAADAIQIAADAAAVGAIWSFGFSMAAFAALEAAKAIDDAVISSKSKDLNNKLTTVDTDISAQINPDVNNYVTQYKQNNNLIASKAAVGLDTTRCRAILMQFCAELHRKTGKLDAATFRQYVESARLLFNSTQINDVYNALDTLNLSAKTDQDIQALMGTLKGLDFDPTALAIVRSASVVIIFSNMKIANTRLKAAAEETGLETSEMDASAFDMLGAVGQFATGVAVAVAVVDAVLDIVDIVDVVEQSRQMVDQLNGSIKDNYKSFFGGISSASQQYNIAITPTT